MKSNSEGKKMAVKARNRKRLKMQELIKNSKKIKCCYCDICDTCSVRSQKEKSENMGIITHCTLTPNILVKKKNKKSKKKTNKRG